MRGHSATLSGVSVSKPSLRALADRLLSDDPSAIETCLEFFVLETRGLWHGRARAMMARRLKHRPLTDAQIERLVGAVTRRLADGIFSEQFRDQLRLALRLRPARVHAVAAANLESEREHVRRLARWVMER